MLEALVGCEKTVKTGSARAHGADHDHRRRERFGENFLVRVEPVLRPQPFAQDFHELACRCKAAERVERSLFANCLDQHFQRAQEPGVAEIVEPGLPPCRVAQIVEIEGQFGNERQLVQAAHGEIGNAHDAWARWQRKFSGHGTNKCTVTQKVQ